MKEEGKAGAVEPVVHIREQTIDSLITSIQSYIDDEELNFALVKEEDYGSDMWSRGYLFAMRRILRDIKTREASDE